jgi:hypothetical protein
MVLMTVGEKEAKRQEDATKRRTYFNCMQNRSVDTSKTVMGALCCACTAQDGYVVIIVLLSRLRGKEKWLDASAIFLHVADEDEARTEYRDFG